jgi:hypothetical protein
LGGGLLNKTNRNIGLKEAEFSIAKGSYFLDFYKREDKSFGDIT